MGSEKIIERLKQLRKKNGYTQQNVADILGLKRATYAKYENGQATPPIAVFIRLATMYGVNVDYLSGRDNGSKNVMSENTARTEDRTDFFNFFLSMNDEQREATLQYMKNLLDREEK